MLFQVQGDLGGGTDRLVAVLEDRKGDDIGQALAFQPMQAGEEVVHLKVETLVIQVPAGFFAVVGNRELIKRAHGGSSTMVRRVYGLFGRLPSRNRQSRLSLGAPCPGLCWLGQTVWGVRCSSPLRVALASRCSVKVELQRTP